ncbi:hypothetical protein ACWC5I_01375 [Kitasatospora sp. NPDC001574]
MVDHPADFPLDWVLTAEQQASRTTDPYLVDIAQKERWFPQ